MKTNVAVDIRLPRVPNFILTKDGHTIPLADFTDDELRAIGAQWINNLVELAKTRRKK